MSTIKVDAHLATEITAIAEHAARFETLGYDGVWTGESKHDAFLALAAAAPATSRVSLGSEVAIAFARSPMSLAQLGWDMQEYSSGRFILGLGSQVKAHIERRYSMPWSRPAARMREMVLAIRAIWDCWTNAAPLDFRGEFYQHTLMTPFFTPEPSDHPLPPVYLAGVGPAMTEVAGEVADGFFLHPFTTPRFLREVTRVALERGRVKAAKTLDGFDIGGPVFAAIGRDETELAAAVEACKARIAFYASTPQYRPVLELHGWGDVHDECHQLARQGRWSEMHHAISDEVVEAIAEIGDPVTVGRGLARRYGGLVTRLSLYAPYPHDAAIEHEVVDALRAAV